MWELLDCFQSINPSLLTGCSLCIDNEREWEKEERRKKREEGIIYSHSLTLSMNSLHSKGFIYHSGFHNFYAMNKVSDL